MTQDHPFSMLPTLAGLLDEGYKVRPSVPPSLPPCAESVSLTSITLQS